MNTQDNANNGKNSQGQDPQLSERVQQFMQLLQANPGNFFQNFNSIHYERDQLRVERDAANTPNLSQTPTPRPVPQFDYQAFSARWLRLCLPTRPSGSKI